MSRRAGIGGLLVAALAVAGCVSGDADPTSTEVVDIFGPYRGEEADLFTDSFDDFTEATGIEIRYTGTGSFVPDLEAQILEAANPPDIAMVPQPGLVAELARDGYVLPLPTEVETVVAREIDPALVRLGEVDGVLVGVPFRISVKSFVWYRPEVFDRYDLTPPDTMAELAELVDTIEDDITTPWCLGIEAEAATGWPATDWTEDLVLRFGGAEAYDAWVAGDIDFADPTIEAAFAEFQSLALAQGRVDGGSSTVLRTSVQAAHAGLFAEPPTCLLYKQASFAIGWMPDDLEFGPDGDIDAFVLPGVTPDPPPVVLGTDLAVAFDVRPEVATVLAHLASPAATRAWERAGGFVPARTESPVVPQAVDRATRDAVAAASTVRTDGSDTMPPAIGTTLFWQSISRWIAGSLSYDEFAATLDEARAGPN